MCGSVAIDAVGAKYGGAARVLQAVVGAALTTGLIDRLWVFCSPRAARDFSLAEDPRLVEIKVKSASEGGIGRVRWHRFGLPAAVGRLGVDSLMCLSGGGEAPEGVPSVTLIQQSIPFEPEVMAVLPWATRFRMTALKMTMRRSCARSAGIVVQTPTMKRWVVRDFGLSGMKVHVIEPGPNLPVVEGKEWIVPQEMAGILADRRILYIGNTSPYKNLALLKPAMQLLRKAIPDATLFATLPEGHPLLGEAGVVGIGRIAPEDLPAYYHAASVLVMPSLVETVGLPMLEAASFGTSVVAADRPYAHDVCGESAVFFDPMSAESLAVALGSVLGSPELRVKLGSLGQTQTREKASRKPYHQMIELLHGITEEACRRKAHRC